MSFEKEDFRNGFYKPPVEDAKEPFEFASESLYPTIPDKFIKEKKNQPFARSLTDTRFEAIEAKLTALETRSKEDHKKINNSIKLLFKKSKAYCQEFTDNYNDTLEDLSEITDDIETERKNVSNIKKKFIMCLYILSGISLMELSLIIYLLVR